MSQRERRHRERHAALGIVRPQPTSSGQDGAIPRAAATGGKLLASLFGDRSLYLPGTVKTAQGARATTRPATLPTECLEKPLLPWVPTTRRSARFEGAARTICRAGSPSIKRVVARTPLFFAFFMRVASCC